MPAVDRRIGHRFNHESECLQCRSFPAPFGAITPRAWPSVALSIGAAASPRIRGALGWRFLRRPPAPAGCAGMRGSRTAKPSRNAKQKALHRGGPGATRTHILRTRIPALIQLSYGAKTVGAIGENRTHTAFRPPPPQDGASTSSATIASWVNRGAVWKRLAQSAGSVDGFAGSGLALTTALPRTTRRTELPARHPLTGPARI